MNFEFLLVCCNKKTKQNKMEIKQYSVPETEHNL